MNRILLFLAFAVCLTGQTAKFPSAIATDADLGVAVDNSYSTLVGAVNSSVTVITVANGAKFSVGEIITVDNEQMQITAINGNNLTVTRGFASTTAAAHNNGTLVDGFLTAWHLNALRKETQAVQTALGVNLANVVKARQMTFVYGDGVNALQAVTNLRVQWFRAGWGAVITSIGCSTNSGTYSITIGNAGTAMNSALTCTTTGAELTSGFNASATIAAGGWMSFTGSVASGTPAAVTVVVNYTVN